MNNKYRKNLDNRLESNRARISQIIENEWKQKEQEQKAKQKQMRNKTIGSIIVFAILIIVGLLGIKNCIGYNQEQNFQVRQSPFGEITIQSTGGWYTQFFNKIWVYPKVDTIYFSNEKAESKDNDALPVRFNNKGTGFISVQIIASYFSDAPTMQKLHVYAQGNVETLQNIIEAKLKEVAMKVSSDISSNQAIENYSDMNENMRKLIVGNEELKAKGINITQFSITKVDFDRATLSQFEAQQQSELERRLAEAQKVKFESKKQETIAKYEQEQAESEGKAKVVMIKETTDAERQKKLAEIEAEKKVAVENFAKQEALIKMSKEKEMAEIEAQKKVAIETLAKQEAEIKAQKELEVAKLNKLAIDQQAAATIAQAEAKQKELELARGLSEFDRYRLQIEKETKIGVAQAAADGIGKVNYPRIMMGGAGKDGNVTNMPLNTMESLMQFMLLEKADRTAKQHQ